MEASRWNCRASELVGLKRGSYEAYCLDQAVGYVGAFIEAELQKVGHKPSKQERKTESAREKVLHRYLGGPTEEETQKGHMDPAAFFAR